MQLSSSFHARVLKRWNAHINVFIKSINNGIVTSKRTMVTRW